MNIASREQVIKVLIDQLKLLSDMGNTFGELSKTLNVCLDVSSIQNSRILMSQLLGYSDIFNEMSKTTLEMFIEELPKLDNYPKQSIDN